MYSDSKFPKPEDVYAKHEDGEAHANHDETADIEDAVNGLRKALDETRTRRTMVHYK